MECPRSDGSTDPCSHYSGKDSTRCVAGLVRSPHQQVATRYSDMSSSGTLLVRDALDNLITATGTVGNVSTMIYDWLGRKKEMSDPDMGHWTYQYDLVGNLTLQTDNRGCTVDMDYDELTG